MFGAVLNFLLATISEDPQTDLIASMDELLFWIAAAVSLLAIYLAYRLFITFLDDMQP